MRIFDLISEYQDNYPMYKEFTAELKSLFENLLTDNNVSFLQIETRVKSLPSFLDKVYRLISNNKYFSQNLNDLVGIRLITYYNQDVCQIADLIEREFKVHSKNSEYAAHNRSPDQFGYSSLHYKISLLNNNNLLSNLNKFADIVFEVQIRTVVQHAWATIDHKIRYKTAEKLPKEIQRQIFQLSALFELADTQFFAIKKQLETRELEYLEKYKQGDLTVKINSTTIEYFFQKHHKLFQSIIDEAQRIGFKETTFQHDPNSIRYLLVLLQRLGVETMGELEELFIEAKEKGPQIMEKIYQVISDKRLISMNYPFPVILLILITLRLKVLKFNDMDTDEVVQKLLKSFVKSISLSIENN